jgi:hypothetical protein
MASGIARLATGRNTNVKLVEPPSCSSPSAIVFIGRNRRGQWVAQQQNGLFGGLFVNRAQAVKYALFENGLTQRPSSNWRAKSNWRWTAYSGTA